MRQKKYRGIERKLALWGWGFNIPSLLFFAVFSFAPIIYAIYTSLYDKRVLSLKAPNFVGLKNYIDIFTNKGIGFLDSLKSSAIFSFGAFFPLVIFSLVFSVLVYNNYKPSTQRKFEILWYTPAVISSVVATTIWMLIFDPRGLGNQVVNFIMNTPGVDHRWTSNPSMLRFVTIMVYFWKYIGYYIVLFITGLGTIPGTLYEAARIDGAATYRIFWKFVIPLSKPILMTVGVFEAFSYWNSWYENLIYTDSNHRRLFTLQYVLYNMEKNVSFVTTNDNISGLTASRIPSESLRMALAVVIILPIILTFPFFRKYFEKGLTAGALK